MRIKKFNSFINEAIINPIDFNYHTLSGLVEAGLSRTELIEAINHILNPMGIHFLNYDEFYNSITPQEQATCPPRFARVAPGIQFAYFDTANNRMNIVYDQDRMNSIYSAFENDRNYNMFINALTKIIRHENVHMQQHAKFPRTELPDVRNPKKYFGTKDEIMAHARTAADELAHLPQDQLKRILSETQPVHPMLKMPMHKAGAKIGAKMGMPMGPPPGPPPTSLDLYRRHFDKNDPEYKRFMKYLYMYLKQDGVI